MNKEEQILNFMKKLEISREEAEQLLEDDENDYIGENGEKMSENAKKLRRYEKSDIPKEKKPREKKIDEQKKAIIEIIHSALVDCGFDATITNIDKTIDFGCYTVNLIKHRPPKK